MKGVATKRLSFLNGQLCRPIHLSRAAGMLTIFNINQNKKQMVQISEWKKKKERAYLKAEAAKMLNLSRKTINNLVDKGIFFPPTGAVEGGKPTWGYRSYYSESQVKQLREIQAGRHMGRPRADGLITNNLTPTSLEMEVSMGNSAQLYTKDADGNFIPVFMENTY
jgi:transposase